MGSQIKALIVLYNLPLEYYYLKDPISGHFQKKHNKGNERFYFFLIEDIGTFLKVILHIQKTRFDFLVGLILLNHRSLWSIVLIMEHNPK